MPELTSSGSRDSAQSLADGERAPTAASRRRQLPAILGAIAVWSRGTPSDAARPAEAEPPLPEARASGTNLLASEELADAALADTAPSADTEAALTAPGDEPPADQPPAGVDQGTPTPQAARVVPTPDEPGSSDSDPDDVRRLAAPPIWSLTPSSAETTARHSRVPETAQAPSITPGFEERKPTPPAKPERPGSGLAKPRRPTTSRAERRRGGPARHRPPGLGDPTLDRWRAAASGAIGRTKVGALPKEGAETLVKEGRRRASERAAQRPDYGTDAKLAQPKVPQEPPKTEVLDTGPADRAVAGVKAIGERRLPDQSFAPLGLPPVYPDLDPKDYVPGTARKAVSDLEARLADVGLTRKERTLLTQQLAEAKAKVAAIEEAVTKGSPQQAPPRVTDTGVASLEPLPAAQADVLGDAMARALGSVEGRAKRIVEGAVGQLQGAEVPRLKKDADAQEPAVRSELDGELRGIAAAAGVGEEQLRTKIKEQKELAAKEAAAVDKEVVATGARTTDQLNERADEESAQIAGAKQAVDRENTAKRQAVSGPPDTAAIEAKRDEYLASVTAAGAAAAAAIRAGIERREAELGQAATQQKAAAKQAADAQAAAIRRHWANDTDRDKGNLEARSTLGWGANRMGAIDVELARLKAQARAWADANTEAAGQEVTAAKDRVRDWAAHQQGRERSWWEQLVDMFTDWFSQASADNAAWERQRNAESRDKVIADLQALTAVKEAQLAGNAQAYVRELATMDAAQQQLAEAYFRGGLSSIAFVAESTLSRICRRRTPELAAKLEQDAIAQWNGGELGELARATNRDFNPDTLANKVRGAIAGWGTDENEVYAGLGGAQTAVERAALAKRYQELFHVSIDEDVAGDMGGHERERAAALMRGDTTAAAAAAIKEAVAGWGTDEAAIRNALRGKTREEVEAIKAEYLRQYHVELKTDLSGDLSGAELDNALALADADVDAADAAELEDAMSGPGTDEEKLRMVYNRIRDEEEKLAREQHLGPGELRARIKARNDRVKDKYNSKYGDLDTNMTAELADVDEGTVGRLRAQGSDLVVNADIKLMQALQDGNETQIDAMRALREHEGVYASDDEIEAIARNQHKRADLDVSLELGAEQARLRALLEEGDISRDEYSAKMADWKVRYDKRDDAITAQALKNMGALGAAYSTATGGTQTFDQLVRSETSGYSRLEIQDLVLAGGKLSDEEEIFYAVAGAGTDEDKLKEVLKGKTKAEIDQIRKRYERVNGEGSFDSDILDDLSGREDLDVGHMLAYGDPDTFAQQLAAAKTPAERQEILRGMKQVLADRRDFEATGMIGSMFTLGGDPLNSADQMQDALDRAGTYVEALDKAAAADREGKAPDPALASARAQFEMRFGGAMEAQEQVRHQIDSITDTAAQVGAAVVGIAVTIATAGAAGPAALAAAAAWGAAASAASSMLIKATLKGAAYSWEDAGVDAAVGVVDTAVSAMTAGIGGRILGRLEATVQSLVLEQAATQGAEEISEATFKAFVRKAMEEAIENGLQGMPSAAVGALLDDATWKSGDPWAVIVSATGQAGAMGAGVGVAMHGVTEGLGAAYSHVKSGRELRAPKGTEPRVEVTRGIDPRQVDLALPREVDPAKAAERALADDAVPRGALTTPEPRPRSAGGVDETIHLDDPANAHLIEEIDGADVRRPHVGDDGHIDLDHPRNAWMIEDRMAGQLPDALAKDASASREFFDGFVRAQPTRESALLVNSVTGDHIVVQGGARSVDVRQGHGVWEELIPPDELGVGSWDLVAHSHPVDATGMTPRNAHFPSGADGDFWYAAAQATRTGQPVRQEIRIQTADGPASSFYGYDPGHAQPYVVDVPGPDGSRQVHRFATMEDYHDFYRAGFGADMGPVPDDFPGAKRVDVEDAADTQRIPRAEPDKPPPTTGSGGPTAAAPKSAGPPPAPPGAPSTALEAKRPALAEMFAEDPGLRARFDDAVRSLHTAAGGLTAADEVAVLGRFAETMERGGIGKRRMKRRIGELERLAESIRGREATLSTGGQQRDLAQRLADAKRELAIAREGGSIEGRPVEPGRRLDRALDDLDRLIHDLPAVRASDPVASRVELDAWHQKVVDVGERIRRLGRERFEVVEHSVTPYTGPVERLGAAPRIATVDVEVRGTLGEGIKRRGMESVLPSAARLRKLDPELAAHLEGWHRGHLVGPGSGSELGLGMTYVPPRLNLGTQNNGVERALRAMPGHVDADVHMRVQAHRYQLPNGEHVDVIQSVEYSIQRLDSEGRKLGKLRKVIINVGPPPGGGLHFGANDLDGLTLDGFTK